MHLRCPELPPEAWEVSETYGGGEEEAVRWRGRGSEVEGLIDMWRRHNAGHLCA